MVRKKMKILMTFLSKTFRFVLFYFKIDKEKPD